MSTREPTPSEVRSARLPIPATNGAPPPWTDEDAPWADEAPGAPAATAEQLERATKPTRTPPSTLLDVAKRWRVEGPLVHEPTGISKLDELTGGGPVYGSRWYLMGAPDAAKTATIVQIAHEWTARGIVVGLLAVDEEDHDIATRVAQRLKFRREECETRSLDMLDELEATFAAVANFFMYGAEWTIEAASADLADRAKALSSENGTTPRIALFVDSIQQVKCNAIYGGNDERSPREVVNANVRALRSVATTYRLIAMATSEMNRGAYRNVKEAEAVNDMAAAKESGAVEYSARVLVALRSVKDHGDLVEARVVKNKHGTSWPAADPFFLRIDRRTMALVSAEAPDEDEGIAATSHERNRASLEREVVPVLNAIAQNPGCGTKGLRAALKLAGVKTGRDGLDVLIEALIKSGRVADRAERRGQQVEHHYHAVSASKGEQ